jgi:hypothetical protein
MVVTGTAIVAIYPDCTAWRRHVDQCLVETASPAQWRYVTTQARQESVMLLHFCRCRKFSESSFSKRSSAAFS